MFFLFFWHIIFWCEFLAVNNQIFNICHVSYICKYNIKNFLHCLSLQSSSVGTVNILVQYVWILCAVLTNVSSFDLFVQFLVFCLFFPLALSYVLVQNYATDCRVLKYIDTSRKEIEIELKELVKLCRWEHGKSYSSIENLKKGRQKLRKLIQKYTVSVKLSFLLCKKNVDYEHQSYCCFSLFLPLDLFYTWTIDN